jgi:hypothetical protein
MPTYYTGCKPGVLDIFSEYSLKIPRIYSNILDISWSGGRGGLTGGPGRRAGGRAGGRTDNLDQRYMMGFGIIYCHLQLHF